MNESKLVRLIGKLEKYLCKNPKKASVDNTGVLFKAGIYLTSFKMVEKQAEENLKGISESAHRSYQLLSSYSHYSYLQDNQARYYRLSAPFSTWQKLLRNM